MPITAHDAAGELIDASDCADDVWAGIHKAKTRALLACRDCGGSLHAKVSSAGLRFFAHDRKPERCASAGESLEHLTLKRQIAMLIRECGYTAILEATPDESDSGGWRADVLGIGEGGRRVAFEVQLASMTIDEGKERTARYGTDNVSAVWISSKHARWMTSLPSVHLRYEPPGLVADRGLARLEGGSHWSPAGEVSFERVVKGMLDGRITSIELGRSYYPEQIGEKTYYIDEPIILVSTRDEEAGGHHRCSDVSGLTVGRPGRRLASGTSATSSSAGRGAMMRPVSSPAVAAAGTR